MMNPQYLPPGQNNNAPNNPIYPPSSQDYNGVQNANLYSQMPANGPQMPKPFDQDMAQKIQNMNLNGPQGFPTSSPSLPPGQLPPGANFTPNQMPPAQRPLGSSFPASAPQPFPPQMGQKPQSQGFGQPPPSQTPDQNRQFPGMQGPPGPKPLTSQLGPMGPPGGMPPHSQPGLPPQPPSLMRQPMPQNQPKPISGSGPQPGQPGLSQGPQLGQQGSLHGLPPQPGQQGPQGLPPQTGFPHSQPNQSHGFSQQSQPPFSQSGQMPRMPPQPGQGPFGPPGLQSGPPGPQSGPPGSQSGPPGPQSGPTGPQSGPPGPQSGPLGPQSQFGAPSSQSGPLGPPGPQPGLPSGPPGPQPGHPSSQPQQPGFPQPPTSQYNQYQSMPGMPHMPPPLTQQRQYPGMPPAGQPPGFGMSTGHTNPAFGMSSMQGQQGQMGGAMPPGYQQPSGYPAYQPPFPAQQQPQKRLDPDQMPSPIQVMQDDQQNRGGVFVTNEKGLVPPLVTTDFIVDDKGNASPRYIRSSMYSVPVTADLLKQTSMPFCLVIAPMAETLGSEPEPPLLDFAALTASPTMGPVRCCRCKAYMCPYMKFQDAGRHFKCAFCKATTEVPMEYTQYYNSMQQYGRTPAELALGAYEIVATKEYCRNNTLPNPPALVFVIDVSYNAIKSGLVDTVCQNIAGIVESLPKDEQTGKSWTRIGIITYSSTVHFYNIKGTLAQPQMLSVGDVSDMFVPILEGFLVTPEDSGLVLQQLLQQLPDMFRDNKETEIILLPAVQAGLEALKAAETSGQLLVFHTSLPTFNAPGKLTNREDRKLLGTDKEKQILNPQTTAYNELGQLCSAAGVCIELFVCNNSYVDVATIGQLARLTGGHVHKYTYFTADVDGPRLVSDVARVASRATGHDAVMRVRTSTGVRPTDFYGHFFMSNTTDVELAAIDADKAIGIEIKHDDKLTNEDGVYIQVALLYTHRSGQRRLRVLNLSLNVAQQLPDVYRSTELDTCINFLTKQAVWALRELPPRQVREGLSTRCARSLAAYRRHCASPSSAGQLVLPESMKLLPLYTSCLLRSDAIAGGPDITCDDRSMAMYRALTADVSTSVVYTYPRLLPLHTLADAPSAVHTVAPLRASVDKMHDQGVYLLENGVHMLVWVGSQAPPDFVRDVFGVTSPQHIDPAVTELPELPNAASKAVRDLIDDVRVKRRSAMRLTVMRQHDKLEAVLRHFLVEDRGVDGSASYVDYLCHIHKEIRTLL